MSAITSIFTAIGDAIIAAMSVLFSFLQGLQQLIRMIPSAVSMLSYSIQQMPPVLTVFAIAFMSVSVVYLVIGR